MKINTLLMTALKILLIPTVMAIFVACTKDNKSNSAAAVAPQEPPTKKLTLNGTSDSSGGNGINYKIFEAYIVDPTTLPAFQKYLKPLFDHVAEEEKAKSIREASSEKEAKKAETDPTLFQTILKFRTWYLAPVDLSTKPNNTIGLYSDNPTQQFALQTTKEVWIDSTFFSKMSEEEQARLILHESLIILYFLKYKTFSEIVADYNRVAPNSSSDDFDPDFIDKLLPPQTMHPMDETDYTNVRAATNFMYNDALQMDLGTIYQKLCGLSFDDRFFGNTAKEASSASKEKPSQMDVTKFNTLIKKAVRLNSLSQNCNFLFTQTTAQTCQLSLMDSSVETSLADSNVKVKSFKFGLHFQNSELDRSIELPGDNPTLPTGITVSANYSMSLHKKYYVAIQLDLRNTIGPTNLQIGDKSNFVVWFLDKDAYASNGQDAPGFSIIGFAIIPLKVYDKHPNSADPSQMTCELGVGQPHNASEDIVYNMGSDKYSKLTETLPLYRSMTIPYPCK